MKAPPPPRPIERIVTRARTAAVQPSTAQPTASYAKRRAGTPSAQWAKWQSTYQDWQYDAKRFARTVGVARFTANMVASTAGRCTLIIQELQPQADGKEEWVETEDPSLVGLMAEYRNVSYGQTSSELLKLHCWHYGVVGEAALVTRDAEDGSGAEWLVVSLDAVEWNKPQQGQVTIKVHPSGAVSEGTAFIVPSDQVFRYWLPDEEWLALSVSPMTASLDDLKRYRSLARYAQRSAENYLAMNGLLWTDPKSHQAPTTVADDDDDPTTVNPPRDPFMEGYNRYAQMSLDGDDQLGAFVPPVFWAEGNKPEHVDFGIALDKEGIAHRKEALEDWARGQDAPASLVVGGGSSDENHWGAWITQDRFIASVAPTLDRVCHQDLTQAFLVPQLRLLGKPEGALPNFRVGYDSTAVIVHPDKSDKALRGWLSGLLSAEATRREMGFEESDKATDEDLKLLAAVLTGFQAQPPAGGGAPGGNGHGKMFGPGGKHTAPGVEPNVKAPGEKAGPGTVVQGPPNPAFTSPGGKAFMGSARDLLDEYLPPMIAVGAGDQYAAGVLAGLAEAPILAAALNGDQHQSGVMVSLPVPPQVASTESVPDGEAPADFHMTLLYLGDMADLTDETHGALAGICAGLASDEPMPDVCLSHVERFAPNDEGMQPVTMVDAGPDCYALRERLVQMCEAAGVPWRDDHAFRAHVTLGYWPEGDGPEHGPLPEAHTYSPDSLMLHWGDEVSSYPFVDAPESGALPQRGATVAARRAYSEDQPRDYHGRFGEATEIDVVTGAIHTERASMDQFNEKTQADILKNVAAKISDNPADIEGRYRALLESAKGTPAWEDGMTWYQRTHDEAVRIAESTHTPLENVIGALAEQSSGAHWTAELPVTEAMIRMDQGTVDLDATHLATYNDKMERLGVQPIENGMKYSDLDTRTAVVAMQLQYMQNLPDNYDPAVAWGIGHGFKFYDGALNIIRNGNVDENLSGPKYRSFYDNIAHPESDRAVTIDKFMVGAAADKYRNDAKSVETGRIHSTIFNDSTVMGAPSRGRTTYDENGVKTGVLHTSIGPTPYLGDVLRKLADENGILPQQAQAIIWVQVPHS